MQRTEEVAIYRNPAALPRAFLVHMAEEWSDDEALLARLANPSFPISTTALLTETPPALALPPPGEAESATITRYTPLEVDIVTQAAAPALLVLADTHYPGWVALVDGRPAHVYTVDSILRGVAVPAGRHDVRFHYRPRSFTIGAALTACGLLVVLALLLWRDRIRAAQATTSSRQR